MTSRENTPGASVVILVADGARPDTLAAAMDRGDLPALARLRSEGGFHEISSVFPSVTGAAYTPFLTGRYPGPIGVPGIRWFERDRSVTRWPAWSRSYMGVHLHAIDSDLDPAAPTLFELAGTRLGALSFIERGLPARDNVVSGARFFFRAAFTHFFGSLSAWTALDRAVCMEACARLARDKPGFAFIVVASIDKASHAHGHDSAEARAAMRTVDDAVARIRADAERDDRWDGMHLMVVSDHGHSPVRSHEDLAELVESWGVKVRAHPWTWGFGQRAAVMVSGNAMAHLYLDLQSRARRFWPDHAGAWEWLAEKLLERESTDLLILPMSMTEVEIRARGRGAARLRLERDRYSYHCESGDPLGIGEQLDLDDASAYDVAMRCDYPDAFAQLTALCGSARCGDLLISASRNWDLRAKWEPVNHVSSHGALHREHMMVPLLVNRPVTRTPRRTVDVFATALAALGLKAPAACDGESWL